MADNIAQWLDGLGPGRYAPAFAANGVELEHLPHLTLANRCPRAEARIAAGTTAGDPASSQSLRTTLAIDPFTYRG